MRLGQRTLDPARPLLVGILNLTPDSFSDGGELPDIDAVLRRAERLVRDGADLLDLGGESTRPGASPVSAVDECLRVVPAISAVSQRLPVPLSVDTRRSTVAREALAAGAVMVNDVSGFGDTSMGEVVAMAGAAWVIMHMPASPAAMQWSRPAGAIPDDVDAALERIAGDLTASVQRATAAGVSRDQIAIDPGIGFGKSVAQNLALLAPDTPIARIGLPLYFGPSRKSFLAAVIGGLGRAAPSPRERVHATAAAVTAAVLAGAAFVRVHDVKEMRDVLDVAAAIRDAGNWRPKGP
jgi:dihydropteroate synthase